MMSASVTDDDNKDEKDEDDDFFDDSVFAQLDEFVKAHEEKKTLSQAALSQQQPDVGAHAAAAAPRDSGSNLRPADVPPRAQLPPAGPYSSQQQQQQQQWNPTQHPHVHQHNPQQQQQQQQQWNPSQHNPQQQQQQQQQQQWNPTQHPLPPVQHQQHQQRWNPSQHNPQQQQHNQQQQQQWNLSQHNPHQQQQQQQQWNPSQQPPSVAQQQQQQQQWNPSQQPQSVAQQQQQWQQQQPYPHKQQLQQQQPWRREPLHPPQPNGFLPRQGPQVSHHLPPGSVSREAAASLNSHNGPGAISTAALGSSSSHSNHLPPQHNPDLERRLAQEEGTNTLLRQKLEAAEQAKFELQRSLNMQQANLTQQGDPQASVEELSAQLRSLQQQLQHAQAEAEEAKREGRERDLRLQEASRRSHENQRELDKVRQVKQQLEQELEDANRERRARATQASTPLSLTQPAGEDAQARTGPPLSGAKRRRNSSGNTTPGPSSGAAAMQVTPSRGSRGAMALGPGLLSPVPPAATPQQQQRQSQSQQQRTPHRQQQHPLEPTPPPPWASLVPVPPRPSSNAMRALLSECCDDLYVLMGCGGGGRQASAGPPHPLLLPKGFPLEPPPGAISSSGSLHTEADRIHSGSIESLDHILAARVCRDLQGIASGALEPVDLCRTLAQHVIAYSSAPEATASTASSSSALSAAGVAPLGASSAPGSAPQQHQHQQLKGTLESGDMCGNDRAVSGGWHQPRRRAAVWEFGEPKPPPDHGSLKAALAAAGCLVAHDAASRTELLRLCGCGSGLLQETAHGGAMETDADETDGGGGPCSPHGELLAALLRVAARLLGGSSPEAQGPGQSSSAQALPVSAVLSARPADANALSAVVIALGRLLDAALENGGASGDVAGLRGTRCHQAETAFCRLMVGGDGRDTLRPILRSDSPQVLRAAVLRLVSGRAAASAELLGLWGLIDTAAADPDAGEDGRPTIALSQFSAGAEKRAGGRQAAASASSGGAPQLADLILDNLVVDPSAAGGPTSIAASGSCIAEQLQASLSLGPVSVFKGNSSSSSTPVWPGQFEAARAALEVVAALMEHSQWPSLRHLIARGLGQNLAAALDAATRDPPQPSGSHPTPPPASTAANPASSAPSSTTSSHVNGAVLESLRPPAALLLFSSGSSGGGDLARRDTNRGAAPSPHPQARRLAAERLRLAHEVLVLLDALLSDRHLEWPLLDDLCASSASLRLCLTTTARLSAAMPTHQQQQQQPSSSSFSSSSRGSAPPHQAPPGLPLSPWASALLLRSSSGSSSSSASSSASATSSSATSASMSAPRQHHRRRDDSSCRGVLYAAPDGCCSFRHCSLQEVARTAARVRLKVLQSHRPDAHNDHHQR